MPEEINRVIADTVSDLRFCPSQTAVDNLATEGITTGVHLVGDVMVDAALTFGPIALRRSRVHADLGIPASGHATVTVHRQSNTTDAAMPALVAVLEAMTGHSCFRSTPAPGPRWSARGLLGRAAAAGTLAPPLGYLDFTALLASASVCLTDSGGVQKEAYMHRVPA